GCQSAGAEGFARTPSNSLKSAMRPWTFCAHTHFSASLQSAVAIGMWHLPVRTEGGHVYWAEAIRVISQKQEDATEASGEMTFNCVRTPALQRWRTAGCALLVTATSP